MNRDDSNRMRFDATARGGHYESWFIRANHPTERRAFWIRYTIFQSKARPEAALGELWAIVFRDGAITAVKEQLPWSTCTVGERALDLRFGDATLDGARAEGEASALGHTLKWSLGLRGGTAPLLLLPENLYDAPFPKAKALVPRPLTIFDGTLQVDGEELNVERWVGSQNHNWGSKHTDRYAWGQVAGFDDHPDTFLEVSTAKVKLGPFATPWMTPIVLRVGEREHRINALWRTVRNRGRYDEGGLRWDFSGSSNGVRIEGNMEADAADFVALPYGNPPGGEKICLNSKIARCALRVMEGSSTLRLQSDRAAFEILTEAPGSIRLLRV